MMLGRTKSPAAAKEFSPVKKFPAGAAVADEAHQWEVRPGGMLVQKRDPDSPAAAAAPTIRVRVKYGAAYHEIYLSSQSTFGELKKLLSERSGLHPEDLKAVYKDKERDSSAYLDISGVKDGSKVVVVDDPAGRAKRLLEMRHQAKIAKASNSISQISLEVDKLASQVSELDAVITKGGKVAKKDVVNLIELLMTQLVKLDGIVADGDLKHQKRMQERRVQKYVEKLDVLKVKNDALKTTNEQMPAQQPPQKQQQKKQPPSPVVTTKWETFDSLFSPTTPATATPATATTNTSSVPTPRFDWELF